ncbi:Signal transduction histidine-protein kinase/phosphatase DegS [Planctomycetes bacterium Poly30]|uniref:Signal transduction histidine-protein kinase/phosphatase DegS n=1 Tax=Saltatorellus ferox TaxID=2528018 RepID=A0A518F185_9BACT|nr:Signal transduction histidine-protein kinase/phosphatase DegS [Planctomycetes bacterium Poly30]
MLLQPDVQGRTSALQELDGTIAGATPLPPHYQVSAFGPEDGLPSRGVRALEVDVDGRLWLGTAGGIAIYDGLRFKILRASQTPGLGNERITSLARDSQNDLWIGTSGGPLSRYRDGRFEELAPHDVLGDVEQIVPGRGDQVWFAGLRLGLSSRGQLSVFRRGDPEDDQPIRRIALDRLGEPWVASNSGLYHLEEGRLIQLSDRSMSWVLADLEGDVWARESVTGQLFAVEDPATFYPGVEFDQITDEVETGPDDRVITTSKGLFSVGPASPDPEGTRAGDRPKGPPTFTRIDSLGDVSLHGLARSAQRDLWVGTSRDGLLYLEPSTSVPVALSLEDVGRQPSVRLVQSIGEEKVIVRTTEGDQAWVVGPDGSSLPILLDEKRLRDLTAACVDDQKRVILGAGEGLFFLEGHRAVPVPGYSDPVEFLCSDSTGTVWYAEGYRVTEWVTDPGRQPRVLGPFGHRVRHLIPVSDGLLSLSRDVIELGDPDTEVVTTLHTFPGATLRSAFEDHRGHLWVTTYGHGLYRLRGDDCVDHWNLENGLPDLFLGWIGDPSGHEGRESLWVNSNSGSIRLDVGSLDPAISGDGGSIECTLHGGPEGNGPWGGSFLDGHLALPTVDGLTLIDTFVASQHSAAPSVLITSVEANGDPWSATTALFGSATLQFRYAALVFPTAENTLYRYRLEGYDESWVDNGHERTVRFTDLPPGDYRFQVEARSSDSPWSEPVETATFTIHRHWFQQWPIRALLLATLLGLLRLLYAWRTEAIRNKSVELEAEVEQRRVLERALRASARNHRTTLETAIDGIVTCDKDGTIRYVNPALETMLGFDHADLEGQPISHLGIEGVDQALEQFARKSLIGNATRATTIQREALQGDGSPIDVEITIGRTGASHEQRLVCVIRDISERKRMIDAIAQSERRFRGLFQTAPSAIFVWHRDGSIAEWNDYAGRLFGWHAEPPGKTDLLDQITPKAHHGHLQEALTRAFDGHVEENLLSPTVTALGEVRSCRWYFSPIKDGNGDVHTVLALVLDVTDEERLAQSVERLRQRLVKAEETERSRIARELHDDLSQRLAALTLDAQLITQAPDSEDPHRASISRALAVERVRAGLASIAVDVHSISRQLHPTVVDDLGLARALKSECARRSEQGLVSVRFADHSEGIQVPAAVALALFRIAQESIRNAERHGSPQNIDVELDSDGECISLRVADDGRGFDPAALAGLPREGRDGGLGLVSIRERAKLVGGSLSITTDFGQGTIVQVSAPLQPATDTDPCSEKEHPPRPVVKRP